jgi:hypothetical protein
MQNDSSQGMEESGGASHGADDQTSTMPRPLSERDARTLATVREALRDDEFRRLAEESGAEVDARQRLQGEPTREVLRDLAPDDDS